MYPGSSATAGPGQFDLVLLDPPWENRSVRRSAKYDTVHESDPMAILRAMLGQHMAPGALVACWITNKASVRDIALESFQAWNVRLIGEWAWLKTTVCGLPVTQVDGLWRKPYEVLLLGRKDIDEVKDPHQEIQRRVIVAVPDLHSRKPHLKPLIEPLLPKTYRALEIFARNLTAEWWSWGDEVLKYNWEGHWSTREENT
ncbi:MT-A70 [Usnea florida]